LFFNHYQPFQKYDAHTQTKFIKRQKKKKIEIWTDSKFGIDKGATNLPYFTSIKEKQIGASQTTRNPQ